MNETKQPDKQITLAVIIGAHGIKGEVRLKIFAADGIDSIKAHKKYNDGALSLTAVRAHKLGAIARFAEINDRNQAEAMRGSELSVRRAALPDLSEDEFYHIDLIGLAAIDQLGEPLGKIIAVENFGASDIIEIERNNGVKFMVAINACKVEVDKVIIDSQAVI